MVDGVFKEISLDDYKGVLSRGGMSCAWGTQLHNAPCWGSWEPPHPVSAVLWGL